MNAFYIMWFIEIKKNMYGIMIQVKIICQQLWMFYTERAIYLFLQKIMWFPHFFIFINDMSFWLLHSDLVLIIQVVSPKKYNFSHVCHCPVVCWVFLLCKWFFFLLCCYHAFPNIKFEWINSSSCSTLS